LIREYRKLSDFFFFRKSLQDRGFRFFLFWGKLHCAVECTVLRLVFERFFALMEITLKLTQRESFNVIR